MEDFADSNKTTEQRPKKKKSAPKIPTNEPEPTGKSTEKKRKAPKIPVNDPEPIYETKSHENDPRAVSTHDQEVPIKPKKKRAPKIEVIEDNNDAITVEQPVKKKKSKAPKLPPPPSIDEEFPPMETPVMDEFEVPVERKSKKRKSKKSKPVVSESFEDIEVPNPDIGYYPTLDINGETNPFDDIPPSATAGSDASEYERAIIDCFSNLASKVNFAEYVGNDQWSIIHLPKTARTEPKSRLRKMLPGGSKDEKVPGKPPVPKGTILQRLRNGVNSLVRDEKNLLFGEQMNYDMGDFEDEPDGVDTDDLHRYAQKLRELEDQDREVNPEFLVLRDGKTVYGVHESDVDGKVKLSARKPIYDRFADQRPDDQSEKKKLLARLKMPFIRNKDRDKDGMDSKSANTTPDPRQRRKASRKSFHDDVVTVTNDEPLMI